MNPIDIEKDKQELKDFIQSKLNQELSTRATKDEVTNLLKEAMKGFDGLDLDGLRSMVKPGTGVMDILAKQGTELQLLKSQGTGKEDLTLRSQVAKWSETHKDKLGKIKNGQKVDLGDMELEVRAAASPMTPSNTLTTVGGSIYLPNPVFESGIHDIRRIQPTLWDYIPKGRTSSAAYVWVNKYNPQGAAAWIGPGVAKPGVSFELRTEISNAKKVAVSMKVATELLQDIDGMATFMQDEAAYQLKKKINSQLQSGTASSTEIGGIQTAAVTFSLPGVRTLDPNNFDAIMAAVAQLRMTYFGEPVTVFVNPIDFTNMILTKAQDSGTYLFPPQNNSGTIQINGVTIVMDQNIAQGYYLAACLGLYKVLIYKDFTSSWGWENDDFTKNLVTMVAEMRMHVFYSANDAGAFIYDTFAQTKVEITAS